MPRPSGIFNKATLEAELETFLKLLFVVLCSENAHLLILSDCQPTTFGRRI